jgi:2'-5' RNA ligase
MITENQKTPEGFAVELYFDQQTEHELRGFREKVYAAGVTPVIGNMGDRPHVSLAVFNKIDLACIKDQVEELAARFTKFEVMLSAVGTFPTPDNVLFLSPVPSSQLLHIHEVVHKQLDCAHLRSSAYYHPGKWLPHCTVELDLPDAQFPLALKAAQHFFAPVKGEFVSLGIVSFRPIEYLAEYQLQKENE